MIHVYYGDGKGKTSAATGLALRAMGHGIPVAVVQFLKGSTSGEIITLRKLSGAAVYRCKPGMKFARDMTPDERDEALSLHNQNLEAAMDRLESGGGVLILDEALDALQLGLLERDLVRELLEGKHDNLEIVITGHTAVSWVFERADYITEFKKQAHPYDKGTAARRGIEF